MGTQTLVVGITGNQALWVSLRSAGLLPAEKIDELIERAERQKRIVESAREAAVRRWFDVRRRSPTAAPVELER